MKASIYAHNIKTQFLPSHDSCTHLLTFQAGTYSAESYPSCFCCGLFLRLARHLVEDLFVAPHYLHPLPL